MAVRLIEIGPKEGCQRIASMAPLRHREIGEQRQRLAPLRGNGHPLKDDLWRAKKRSSMPGHDVASWHMALYIRIRRHGRLRDAMSRSCHDLAALSAYDSFDGSIDSAQKTSPV